MNRKVIAVTAAVAAATLTLSACGSSSKKSGSNGGGSGTIASKLIMGGPAEFKTRADGLPGLTKNYGVTFQSFKTLDTGGPVTVTSLKNGQVDAADLFTTDPAIKANNFVVLTDPKSNFAAQNVLPLIAKAKATAGVSQVLNFISSKLTTTDLINLRTKVEVDKQGIPAAAEAWLAQFSAQKPPANLNKGVSITVGSANFPENEIIAQIYAIALQATGATVKTKFNIGSREKYMPAMQDGEVDLIPEYSGVLLQFFDKNATATSSADVFAALPKALPAKLEVLNQSQAQDADAIVVTKATASKYGLTSIADLAKKA
ncbi:MAG TPA: glycine betaine ABC transporter substrate-binding protein [Jatrophihabitantaceae bacterium]|nr:glycine betaine ABC transporter substrate-binding protein [Jatrophihabitantaceae bacterium]